MSFTYTKQFKDYCRQNGLRFSDTRVLFELCLYASEGRIFTGNNCLLGEEIGYSGSSVREAFRRLEAAGMITRKTARSRDVSGKIRMEREVFLTQEVLDIVGLGSNVAGPVVSGGSGGMTVKQGDVSGPVTTGNNWAVFCTPEMKKWDEPLAPPLSSPLPCPLPSSASPDLSTYSPPYIPPRNLPLPTPRSGFPMGRSSSAERAEPMEGGAGGTRAVDTRRLAEAMNRLKGATPPAAPENDPIFAKIRRTEKVADSLLTPDSRQTTLSPEVQDGYQTSDFPVARSRDRRPQEFGRSVGEIADLLA